MTKHNREEAREFAERAGSQAKHAAKNSGRALKSAAEPMAEDVTEKVQDTAHDAARAAKKINVGVLGRMSSDTGIGFLALSFSIYSGVIAYTKFRQAVSGGSQVISD